MYSVIYAWSSTISVILLFLLVYWKLFGFFGLSELKFCKYFLRFEEILYIETMASGSRLVLGVLIYFSPFSIYNSNYYDHHLSKVRLSLVTRF